MTHRDDAPATARYWSKTAPSGPWDVIVVGSGMGGMTAAALLAKANRRVLVLEQHTVPGGFTHTFKRRGYRWDVGVHAVGEVTEHAIPGRILNRLTDGQLRWKSLGPIYDEFYYPDGFRIGFPDRPERFRALLADEFPRQVHAIDEYLERVRGVDRLTEPYFVARLLRPRWAALAHATVARATLRSASHTTGQVLERLTDDAKLRALLTAQCGYYGATPKRSSWFAHAIVMNHFIHGAFYPVGGAATIARCLLKPVAEAGGWTRLGASVRRVIVRDGRAVGVELADGEEIFARQIISAAGIGATVRRLLPERYRQERWVKAIEQLGPSPAHVALYLGFKGDIRQAGASSSNRWLCNTWDSNEALWRVEPGADLPTPPRLYCSFASLKDPLHEPGPEQRHTGEVVTFVPHEPFRRWQDKPWRHRGEDYEAFKQRLAEAMLEQLFARLPELRPLVDYTELSTPLSTDTFCRSLSGAMYGLEHTPARFRCRWLRPPSPIAGLFFAGCDVCTAGVVGAQMGGVLAAVCAAPWAALNYLRRNR